MGGFKYDTNNILLAANYFQAKNKAFLANDDAIKFHGIEAVAQYRINLQNGRLIPSVAYVEHKIANAFVNTARGNLVKYVSIGATYEINKHIATFVDYKFNLLKEKDILASFLSEEKLTKDSVGIGLVYQF